MSSFNASDWYPSFEDYHSRKEGETEQQWEDRVTTYCCKQLIAHASSEITLRIHSLTVEGIQVMPDGMRIGDADHKVLVKEKVIRLLNQAICLAENQLSELRADVRERGSESEQR